MFSALFVEKTAVIIWECVFGSMGCTFDYHSLFSLDLLYDRFDWLLMRKKPI